LQAFVTPTRLNLRDLPAEQDQGSGFTSADVILRPEFYAEKKTSPEIQEKTSEIETFMIRTDGDQSHQLPLLKGLPQPGGFDASSKRN